MVMSDSGDTDILLLIPPNYFSTNAEDLLLHDDCRALLSRQFNSLQELNCLEQKYRKKQTRRDLTTDFLEMELGSCKNEEMTVMASTSYQCLPPTRKAELNHINAKLHHLERDELAYRDCPSDISSISANTVKTHFGSGRTNRGQVGMAHSTPKYRNSSLKGQDHQQSKKNTNSKEKQDTKESGVLSAISQLQLNDGINNNFENWPQGHINGYNLEQEYQNQIYVHSIENCNTHTNSPPATTQIQPHEKSHGTNSYQMSKSDNNFISLSELWGKSGQLTAVATSSKFNLNEEKLRRQHLEKTVRQLQTRLLEYQQRLSIAIEVDRSKDNAINNALMEKQSLNEELQLLRKRIQETEQQHKNYDEKLDKLQKELSQAVTLATKFQEKTEKLETELTNCSRKTNESCNQYKQKVEELELKVHACKRSEEFVINELDKIKDKYAKSEHLYEKTKLQCEELKRENTTMRHQKDMLQDYHQKQKIRADNLDTQRKSLQESLARVTENETALKKKLDLQQKTLKSHYQQQLENVVAQKLKEFQEQLDKTEETLKSEARDRERLIAERAVKQLELINEKNELELNLLQEKHNEEVELYRIQLANASKKIDELEMKINVLKSNRADIAEKLHKIMETQWQKALEILTSSHNITRTTYNDTENDSPSLDTNETHNRDVLHHINQQQNQYETPKSSKKENNFNVLQKKETSPMDKLQAYIELLLSKSPTDIEKLDEILALTSKAKESNDKLEKSAKRHYHSKPPWKA